MVSCSMHDDLTLPYHMVGHPKALYAEATFVVQCIVPA